MQFIMKQLCKMIEKLIQESREVLFYDLMLIKSEVKIPVISWSSLRDNLQNEEVVCWVWAAFSRFSYAGSMSTDSGRWEER